MGLEQRIAHRIGEAELQRRWRAVRDEMAARDIDALIMQSQNDWLGGYVKWFTDIPAANGYPRTVLFPLDDPMVVVDMGPFEGRRALGSDELVHRGVGLFLTTPAFLSIGYTARYHAQALTPEIRARGCRRIGLLCEGAMPAGLATALRESLGEVEFVDATDFVDAFKAIKSPEEIAAIRRVAALQDRAFAAVLAGIEPGLCDSEIAALAWSEAQRGGSEQGITLGCSARLGEKAGFVGRHAQGRRIESGDHFTLLIEVNGAGGFYAELARTIVLGPASAAVLEGFAAMAQAQAHTLSLIRPGADCAEIAAAHDDWMRRNGRPPERRLYAHGQGYDMVERPLIRRDETMRIEANMNLAVHPGYETETLFAVVCDNYLVEPEGPPRRLHETESRVFEIV